MDLNNVKIAVIGLGYVGLPLAVEFAKKYPTVGFDIDRSRIADLNAGKDKTLEIDGSELTNLEKLTFTCNMGELKSANVYIVTVPTPINQFKQPDLTPLIKASETIGTNLNIGDIVIYESTVYPGATEEDCVPVLEQVSGLVFNNDFFVGYSPERINPGDKEHRVSNIPKVTSGSTLEVAEFIDQLYSSIITAGTHKAESIRVAEAAKIIENVQRDVNIALFNELHQIFEKLGINTIAVIEAASTKWNFMKLLPGLVGGHCIGVDPYYMLHKSHSVGYIPDLIRNAREINDGFSEFVAQKLIKDCLKNNIPLNNLNILILGASFKANCADLRNSKVFDVAAHLRAFGLQVGIFDPIVDSKIAERDFNEKLVSDVDIKNFDVALMCVQHKCFETTIDEIVSGLRYSKVFYFLDSTNSCNTCS